MSALSRSASGVNEIPRRVVGTALSSAPGLWVDCQRAAVAVLQMLATELLGARGPLPSRLAECQISFHCRCLFGKRE